MYATIPTYDRSVPAVQKLSPTARRTRRLIVDTAIETLGEHRDASLGEIAEAAGVSRSTLHRHFTDRSALLAAVDDEVRNRFDQATERARLGDGSALDALDRLIQELLQLGPVLSLIFADQPLVDPDRWDDADDRDRSMIGLVESGQARATIDPELSADWVQTAFWGLLIGAVVAIGEGMDRRTVSNQLSRTLRNALTAR